jgi:hypothetical protein
MPLALFGWNGQHSPRAPCPAWLTAGHALCDIWSGADYFSPRDESLFLRAVPAMRLIGAVNGLHGRLSTLALRYPADCRLAS